MGVSRTSASGRGWPLNHRLPHHPPRPNYWRVHFALAGLTPEKLVDRELISNNHEILVFEPETMKVCRLPIRNLPFPLSLITFNHLAFAALELWIHGGWSLKEIASFGLRVMGRLKKPYRNDFEALAALDEFLRVSDSRREVVP